MTIDTRHNSRATLEAQAVQLQHQLAIDYAEWLNSMQKKIVHISLAPPKEGKGSAAPHLKWVWSQIWWNLWHMDKAKGTNVLKCHYDESLVHFNLHPRILSGLRRGKFKKCCSWYTSLWLCGNLAKLNTVKSVLVLSDSELVRRCGLSHSDVENLTAAASLAVFHHTLPNTTALHLFKEKQLIHNHGRQAQETNQGWSFQ